MLVGCGPDPVSPLRVLGLQIANARATTAEGRDANVRSIAACLREHSGYEVYLLPELATVGYSDAVMGGSEETAEDAMQGPSAKVLGEVARKLNAFVVYGFPRRDKADTRSPTISQNVLGPDGSVVATYDKLHLCSIGDCSEKCFFRSGDHLTVFTAQRGFCVGVLICYDVRFSDVWAALARDCRVDLVLHPSAFARDRAFSQWLPFVATRACENQIYVLSLSFGDPSFGGSIAIGPGLQDVEHVRRLGCEQSGLPLLVDRSVLEEVRRDCPFGGDRRSDYSQMVKNLQGKGKEEGLRVCRVMQIYKYNFCSGTGE
uniref:CN hydrolase domain-containing protein n=1 Tax=Chromera velia CCMP2878 TaxID=1169474 RepID=A0A0G4I8G6_9ALVE|eukprot:Cvel_11947.t1-p1 / transcript=Cvel_11947.t1 / gene=Cvel_11947 / organism=Chromera_velia_CCMP2878 / gene_product=Omega-amidase NIT2, putative / transcript_product=Omega-amidase NIT2, putative / location=Cvel_scaffold765:51309-52253(-) / protein_length=315 / sequence_SO=supercontig / SO=protein_coding / is_pseudo=false